MADQNTDAGVTIVYDFVRAIEAWSRLPLDDVGYVDAQHLLQRTDNELRTLVADVERRRYNTQDWRNWQNQWREFFGLDTTTGKTVLDFGCGLGVEALQFARAGNEVGLADINPYSVALAARVLRVHGFEPAERTVVSGQAPYFWLEQPVDIFYASGVLHHTPEIRGILRQAIAYLRDGGECRILVYSDRRWTRLGIPLPPVEQDIRTHTAFSRFVRACDEVGEYTDWYTPEKLALRIEGFGCIERWQYIGRGEEFVGAVIVPQ